MVKKNLFDLGYRRARTKGAFGSSKLERGYKEARKIRFKKITASLKGAMTRGNKPLVKQQQAQITMLKRVIS